MQKDLIKDFWGHVSCSILNTSKEADKSKAQWCKGKLVWSVILKTSVTDRKLQKQSVKLGQPFSNNN